MRMTRYRTAIFVLFGMLTGCIPPATSIASPSAPPVPSITHQAIVASIGTSTQTSAPEPTTTSVPHSRREPDGMTMVYIPAGDFTMGSDTGEPEEGPAHEVYLDAYWIDRTEITNAMYAICVDAGSCQPPMDTGSYTRTNYYGNQYLGDYPVIFVDWEMANTYCRWAEARLPTEAEWEKAARGENAQTFPWGEAWDVRVRKRLNFADKNNPEMTSDLNVDDGHGDTAPVGSYPAGQSPYGVFDLAGNVWEWVADWYDPLYYLDSTQDNPAGPAAPTREIVMKSMRGGGWVAANEHVFHTYNRHGEEPSKYSSSIGFRCVR